MLLGFFLGWGEVTSMLFKNNPLIGEKYFGVTLGKLVPGAAADVIVMDYKPFTPFSKAYARQCSRQRKA